MPRQLSKFDLVGGAPPTSPSKCAAVTSGPSGVARQPLRSRSAHPRRMAPGFRDRQRRTTYDGGPVQTSWSPAGAEELSSPCGGRSGRRVRSGTPGLGLVSVPVRVNRRPRVSTIAVDGTSWSSHGERPRGRRGAAQVSIVSESPALGPGSVRCRVGHRRDRQPVNRCDAAPGAARNGVARGRERAAAAADRAEYALVAALRGRRGSAARTADVTVARDRMSAARNRSAVITGQLWVSRSPPTLVLAGFAVRNGGPRFVPAV